MKAWKALLICLMLSALCSVHAYAASNRDNSRLCFGNIKYSQNGANVTVSGDVSNNQSVTKNAMLMVASYDDDGRMYNLRINKQSV